MVYVCQTTEGGVLGVMLWVGPCPTTERGMLGMMLGRVRVRLLRVERLGAMLWVGLCQTVEGGVLSVC